MTRNMWAGVVLGLAICAGCLDGALPGPEPGAVLKAVSVVDASGGAWPREAMPRMPTLTLGFDREPGDLAGRLWLVAGHPHPDLLDDLADPPLRASSLAALVPLRSSVDGRTATAQPERALEPGARYALVHTGGEQLAWFALRVSASPAAGARLAESWPGDRDVRVPPNLQRILLRFDGYVPGLAARQLALHSGDERIALTAAVASCSELGLGAGDCVWLTPAEPIAAGRAYELAVEGLHDATGAVLPAVLVSFATQQRLDMEAPTLSPIACALDEIVLDVGCLLPAETRVVLRAEVSEPALVTLAAGAARAARLALGGQVEVTLEGLSAGATLAAQLRVEDLAGERAEHGLSLETAYALAPVTIDEVRPDPLGPEPAQEYVELLNFGSEPVNIMGFSLTDDSFDAGRVLGAQLAMAPGERVLVVGPDFDAREPSDGELPAGVRLVRLAGPLSLRNDGDALFLRDELGRRVAESPRVAPHGAGQCVGRLVDASGRAEFVPDPRGGCTPGTATLEPDAAAAEPAP
jgi:hypothetical protein